MRYSAPVPDNLLRISTIEMAIVESRTRSAIAKSFILMPSPNSMDIGFEGLRAMVVKKFQGVVIKLLMIDC